MKYGFNEIIEMGKKGIKEPIIDAIVKNHWEVNVDEILEAQKHLSNDLIITAIASNNDNGNDGKKDDNGNKNGNKKGTGKKSKYNWIKDFNEDEYKKKAIEMNVAIMEGDKFIKVGAKNREKVYRACGFIE